MGQRHHGVSAFQIQQELDMSRILQSLRASVTVGAFLIAGIPAHAADAQVQRLAMARTHGSDAVAPARTARAPASEPRADMAVAKAPVRRSQQRSDSRDSDGSRFTYDSCGCSN
jgi:hypothetical protein